MDLFSKLKHKSQKINLMIEFTGEDLIVHFEHKIKDPTLEIQCKICKQLKMLKRHIPDLKELIETKNIKKKSTTKSRSQIAKRL
jgi:hypothetical protein